MKLALRVSDATYFSKNSNLTFVCNWTEFTTPNLNKFVIGRRFVEEAIQ